VAVAPLFIASMTILKTRLRLEGASAAGALAQIDQAVEDVTLGFYNKLGAARVATIKATTYTEAPTSNAEILRSLANSVEVKWVRYHLIRVLPNLFMDGSGTRQQTWNDEGVFSTTPNPRSELEKELARLLTEIEDGLLLLEGEVGVNDGEGTVSVTDIGPSDTPDLPGASVFPALRRSSIWTQT